MNHRESTETFTRRPIECPGAPSAANPPPLDGVFAFHTGMRYERGLWNQAGHEPREREVSQHPPVRVVRWPAVAYSPPITTTTSVRVGAYRKNRGGGPGSFGHGFCLYARQSRLAGTNKREGSNGKRGTIPGYVGLHPGGVAQIRSLQRRSVGAGWEACTDDRTSIGKPRFSPRTGTGHHTVRSRELSFRTSDRTRRTDCETDATAHQR